MIRNLILFFGIFSLFGNSSELREIEKEKTNTALFEKKVSQIREYYKVQADDIKQQETEKSNQKEQLELDETKKQLANAAVSTEELMGFEIDDKDRSETFDFIFN